VTHTLSLSLSAVMSFNFNFERAKKERSSLKGEQDERAKSDPRKGEGPFLVSSPSMSSSRPFFSSFFLEEKLDCPSLRLVGAKEVLLLRDGHKGQLFPRRYNAFRVNQRRGQKGVSPKDA